MADTTINAAKLRQMLNAMADKIVANKEYLNEVDSLIGDADHGSGMAQSMAKAKAKLADCAEDDISKMFSAYASGIMGGGGGASGALFSAVFTEGAKGMAGKAELTPADVALWWRSGLAKIQERGKAQPGDKTMVDALVPAVEALEQNTGGGIVDQLSKALEAARAGVEATKNMIAGQGRSRYAGERSLGQQDAGATSVALMFEAMRECF